MDNAVQLVAVQPLVADATTVAVVESSLAVATAVAEFALSGLSVDVTTVATAAAAAELLLLLAKSSTAIP